MALIQAFIAEPSILFLDEPMNALDEKSVRLTKQVILSYLKKENGLVNPDFAYIGRYFRSLYRCISCRKWAYTIFKGYTILGGGLWYI